LVHFLFSRDFFKGHDGYGIFGKFSLG
jgi:hypothetical protein